MSETRKPTKTAGTSHKAGATRPESGVYFQESYAAEIKLENKTPAVRRKKHIDVDTVRQDAAPLPDDFAFMLEADFRASASLAVQEAARNGVAISGRDANGDLISRLPNGTIVHYLPSRKPS